MVDEFSGYILQISALLCIALELLHGAKVLNMSWSEVASYELCG